MEEFRELKEDSNYLIYNDGRLFSKKVNRFLKGKIDNVGYRVYSLAIMNEQTGKNGKMLYSHRLVAEYFLPNPNNLPIVHHKDENKLNNNPNNLELMKRSDHVRMHVKERGSKLVELKCPGCGKIFVKEKRNTFLQKNGEYTCCSRKCAGIASHLPPLELQKRINENVIKEFIDNKDKYGL